MRWIGFDPGQVRCGLAVSDPLELLASPVGVLQVEPRQSLAGRIADLLAASGYSLLQEPFGGLVCGLALDQRGREGPAAAKGRELSQLVHEGLQEILRLEQKARLADSSAPTETLALHFVDERFTTVVSSRQTAQAGKGARKKLAEIDAWAAREVLQSFLDSRRAAQPIT